MAGKTFPAHAQPAILHIWQEAHWMEVLYSNFSTVCVFFSFCVCIFHACTGLWPLSRLSKNLKLVLRYNWLKKSAESWGSGYTRRNGRQAPGTGVTVNCHGNTCPWSQRRHLPKPCRIAHRLTFHGEFLGFPNARHRWSSFHNAIRTCLPQNRTCSCWKTKWGNNENSQTERFIWLSWGREDRIPR